MTSAGYRIRIDGRQLPNAGSPQRLEIEDHRSLASMARATFPMDLDANGEKWLPLEGKPFDRLARVQVDIGKPESMEPIFDGYLIENVLRFAEEGDPPALELVAMDGTAKLGLQEKVVAWPNMADSDIATRIFQAHGVRPDVKATQPKRQDIETTVIQRTTDLAFLRHLAQRNGYDCYIEADPRSGAATGRFGPPDLTATPQGTISVEMGPVTNARNIQIRHDMLGPGGASARNVQIASLKEQRGEAGKASNDLLGRTSTDPGKDTRLDLLVGHGLDDASALKTATTAAADRASWAITADGQLDPALYNGILRAKRPVLLRGVGEPYNGTYMVERVLHQFDGSGYGVDFTLVRNATGTKGSERFPAGGAS